MGDAANSAWEVELSCISCGAQKQTQLSLSQIDELQINKQVKLLCETCGTVTVWSAEEKTFPGTDKRSSLRVHVQMPIRVRCASPKFTFTEITTTIDAGRDGASFLTQHEMQEGTMVSILLPYTEGENLPETPARVVHVEPAEDRWQVGVEFVR